MINSINDLNVIDFEKILDDDFWNTVDEKEIGIHKVHVYPAKFPSLIAKKAFDYADTIGIKVKKVADVFCGCGTVAVESRRKGYDFWGCDINPVAVLLSNVKTRKYKVSYAEKLKENIVAAFKNHDISYEKHYNTANERLRHWYSENQYNQLYVLKQEIENCTKKGKYRDLFYCIFSSILKATSKWLTSSIKPQVDPDKIEHDVLEMFEKQCKVFFKAIDTTNYKNSSVDIKCKNILETDDERCADLIITSPPYVTSYEYADLHQLSSLWLGYTHDYTKLRTNSIGTKYNIHLNGKECIPPTADKIINLFPDGAQKRSILNYYSDMLKVTQRCYEILNESGICIFVIGDTELRGHKIENARCLAESLIIKGFQIEQISKRRVENKFLPSHRDKNGKFSSDKSDRKIYSQEYIIIGRKNNGNS